MLLIHAPTARRSVTQRSEAIVGGVVPPERHNDNYLHLVILEKPRPCS